MPIRLGAPAVLVSSPAEFEALLQRYIPGLRVNHPAIADAFERHQPYQPEKAALGHLKQLYRENHHHDFTMQERYVDWYFVEPAVSVLGTLRGPADAPLFLVNHLGDHRPAPSTVGRRRRQRLRTALARLRECERVRAHMPNLVAVNFPRHGDLYRAVDTLNGMR